MRNILLAAGLAFPSLGLAETYVTVDDIAGLWVTSWGEVEVIAEDFGYSGDYDDGGRFILEWSEEPLELEGIWVEDNSDQRCDEEVDGSFHWGLLSVVETHTAPGFQVMWGYCYDAPTRSWEFQTLLDTH